MILKNGWFVWGGYENKMGRSALIDLERHVCGPWFALYKSCTDFQSKHKGVLFEVRPLCQRAVGLRTTRCSHEGWNGDGRAPMSVLESHLGTFPRHSSPIQTCQDAITCQSRRTCCSRSVQIALL